MTDIQPELIRKQDGVSTSTLSGPLVRRNPELAYKWAEDTAKMFEDNIAVKCVSIEWEGDSIVSTFVNMYDDPGN